MGVRGRQFDFITTSALAITAKTIVWVGSETLQTVNILTGLDNYLTGKISCWKETVRPGANPIKRLHL